MSDPIGTPPGPPERPVEVARAFLDALAARDAATAASFLAPDVTFEGPQSRLQGREAVLEELRQFAETVTAVTVIAALGDEAEAMLLYDVDAGEIGRLRVADHFAVHDGRITANTAVFAALD
ncbi:nuclear transport factor 2 family protein [Natronosporangium hydrolyticum]|uniref:Nuclear transport factor 2 family protein n=1 Tax=Natronosporangium hydrolyticum TaxID=2811111 RepID=A0A895YPH3_9ACTN|nr:nuclear transport factor 2 family protein [Natronosporangium hydrolyticum]QSB16626.1 nuclear transport factor 2 family protein [Natronosporangium hydrolyticum]